MDVVYREVVPQVPVLSCPLKKEVTLLTQLNRSDERPKP